MSLSERNTPSHGSGAGSGLGSAAGRQRPPPDVEEALSSMLWTPYERTPMPSSSEGEEEEEEDDDERLNRKLHKSHSSYEASALNQPPIQPHAHSSHLQPIYAHHPPAVEAVPLLLPLPMPMPMPLPPVPSFPNFSLSAFDAAIAGFDLAKAGQAATAEGSGAGGGGRRNRYSFPSYYGSPAHTLTQWCSSAATAIQEPPSYESLYSAQDSTSTSLLAMSSVARPRSGSQPETEPCDRSQRSPTKASASAAAAAAAQQQMRTREQRRRERRERRQQQQQQQQFPPHHPRRHHAPPPPPPPQLHPPPHLHHPHPAAMGLARALLPDILHPHYPPPYSALPVPVPITVVPPPSQQPPPQQPPPPPPLSPSVPPPMLTSVISTVPLPGPGPAGPPLMSDGRFTLPLPIMRRSPSERSGKGCCGQWFAGPPLRALIAVVALGGVACALGGAALGATGLAGPPNSHLTAALLMIGVGVVLVTVSGAAWRMTAPGGQSCLGLGLGTSVDLGRCGRRPCSRGGGAPHGLLYPEFQHRPPPPSYQASMQEYRLRLLLLDRDRQNGVVRGNSPPPTYRSHAGSLLRAPLTTLRSGMGGGGAGGTISSSMGGSEYSLPPSYRSRNATPASFVCGERSIETAPSGRLLANEDLHLPEPSLAEQLTNYTALQSNTLLTSAIVEIERDTPTSTSTSTATKGKDLVTIVTISQADSDSPHLHPQRHSAGKTTHSQTQTQSPGQASALDQIDILAHL
ncbi:uncharacterized protein KIAA1522 isoform X2 [Drosophila guanche]|uniref:uncharacterized protein KIAA1522 isoform X2 n=1 Tax=Drosophila guanche TaxID=7266 RepID=UPI001470AAF9|nr:uncharacterized protein KIAA1522 isoform X2 [Drosophila guanche]